MSSSSIVDYFTSGLGDTYQETVEYWSKDNSIADSFDALTWSVQNPTIVKEATVKGVEKSLDELGTAVQQDTNKIIFFVVLGVGTYLYIKNKGGKK